MNRTLSSTLLTLAALTQPALSQNLLTNGNFDSGGLSGWSSFGNAFAENSNPPAIVPRSGTTLCKLFGNFSGSFNVSGIFQSFSAAPGDTFTLDCWSRHYSGDPLTGNGPPNDNWMVMKIAFFDAGNNEIAGHEGTILDGNSPHDTWIDNTPVMGTAPAGATSVQALVLFLQPATAGGAGHVDDVEFHGPPRRSTYPGSGEDLLLATGIDGTPPSAGPGNDVKTAAGGALLEVRVSSPQSTFDLQPYFVLTQGFATGSPPTPPLPGVHFDFSRDIIILVGHLGPPVNGPVIPPGGGSSTFYVIPSGMSGTSIMLQSVVFSSSTTNGAFAISDGHEIQFQ